MKKQKLIGLFVLAVLALGTISCFQPYGYSYYPRTPRFSPTHPADVMLLRREPRRDHIRLGEVWIEPDPWMSRGYVEGILREKAARMGADALVIVADRYLRGGTAYGYWHRHVQVYDRQIVGIAVRFGR